MLTLKVPSKEILERLEAKDSTNLATSKPSSIRFVSEDECRCDGKFRDRMEEMGVTMKTGISMVDVNYNRSNVHSVKESAKSHTNEILKPENPSIVITSSMYNPTTARDSQETIHKRDSALWEPLTMEALIQNKKGVFVDGL